MAVPKRKKSRSRRDMRRAHHNKIVPVNLIPCPNCGEVMVPHRVCEACGHYNGRAIMPGKEKAEA